MKGLVSFAMNQLQVSLEESGATRFERLFGFHAVDRGVQRAPSLACCLAVAIPRRSYEVIIIGAGGHGLATAYYLARSGIRSIADLKRDTSTVAHRARHTGDAFQLFLGERHGIRGYDS
jgi:hypothetical protein